MRRRIKDILGDLRDYNGKSIYDQKDITKLHELARELEQNTKNLIDTRCCSD